MDAYWNSPRQRARATSPGPSALLPASPLAAREPRPGARRLRPDRNKLEIDSVELLVATPLDLGVEVPQELETLTGLGGHLTVNRDVCRIGSITADEYVVVCEGNLPRTCEVGLLPQGAEVAAIRLPDQQRYLRSVKLLMERAVGAEHQHLRERPDGYVPGCAEQIELFECPADEHSEVRICIDEEKGALLVVDDKRAPAIGVLLRAERGLRGAGRLGGAGLLAAAEREGTGQGDRRQERVNAS
jgi:hypothetical protein